MDNEIKNIEAIINYWRESSEQNLIKTQEYAWALFMGHLVIEKLLKALKKYNISIRIINESPNPILDSLKTKKILGKI